MEKTSASSNSNGSLAVIAFKLDKRTFAIPLNVIVQILPYMKITPIPHLNPIVEGTINIRGEAITVINLRRHLYMEDKLPELFTPFLLLQVHERKLALIVDEVLDVVNLHGEKLDTLEEMLPEGIKDTPLFQGVAYSNDETVLILNPDKLFYNQNLDIPDEADKQEPVSISSISVTDQQEPM